MLAAAAAGALLARQARRAPARSRLGDPLASTSRSRVAMPRRLSGALERWFVRADVAFAPDDAVVVWLASVATLAVLGGSLGGVPAAVAAGSAGVLVPPAAAWCLRHRQVDRLRAAVPELLEAVARELRGGGTLDGALDRLARVRTPLGREAAALRRRSELGLARHEALAAWAESHAGTRAHGAVRSAAAALSIAAMSGGAAAAALDALAESLRDEASVLAEARAQAAQGRMSAVLLASLPVASLVLSSVVEPEAVNALFTTPFGRVALVTGLGLDAVGVWWMQRVVRVGP